MAYIEEIKKRLKEPFWQFLIVLLLFSVLLNYAYVKDMQSLPSPIYGGDYYYQMGAVNHVKYGGSAFASTTTNEELPVYLPLYSFIVGNIARLFDIEAITAMFLFSYISVLFSILITYILSYKLFKNYLLSIISSLSFMLMIDFPVVKYTIFGKVLMVPLFIFLLYMFIDNLSVKNSVFLGIVYGLIGITHTVIFMFATLMLAAAGVYYGIYKNIGIKEKKINFNKIKPWVLNYLIVLIIGVPIALLWWFHPIFSFGGSTGTATGFISSEFTLGYQMKILLGFLKSTFFNFSSIDLFLKSIFSIFGIVGLFALKTKKEELKFIKFLFVSFFIIVFHYFITQNFFGFNLVPSYMISNYVFILSLFSIFGIVIMMSSLKIKINKEYVYYGIILLLLLSIALKFQAMQSDRWISAGKNPLPDHLIDLRGFMVKTGDVNDVILTTKEVGFSVNAMTGRKLVAYRRGHAGAFQFLDLDTRELDLAIMLYGNDTEYKKEIFKKYDVDYIYWDYYWIQSEYYFDSQGKITSWFDPILILHSNEREQLLKENGVKYFVQESWIDPSVRGEGIETHKLIFISPENYYNSSHPWNPNIDSLLNKVWSYDFSGQEIAKLYKINY